MVFLRQLESGAKVACTEMQRHFAMQEFQAKFLASRGTCGMLVCNFSRLIMSSLNHGVVLGELTWRTADVRHPPDAFAHMY